MLGLRKITAPHSTLQAHLQRTHRPATAAHHPPPTTTTATTAHPRND